MLNDINLYKYYPDNSFTIDAIKNNYLYFNAISKFNDPFDSRIVFKYKGNTADFEKYFNSQNIKFKTTAERDKLIDDYRNGLHYSGRIS
jgi:hypothetical protein